MIAVVLALAAASPLDPETAGVFTGIVAAAAAEDPRIDVVTAEDLRHAMDVEASRRAMGCSNDESCLAEIANAMGARLVLYGSAAQLEDELIVTLQLYDSKTGSGTRGIARAVGKRAFSTALADQSRKLVAAYLSREAPPEGQRVRCIVLDLKGDAAREPQAPPPQKSSFAPVTWGGLGVAALGVVGVVIGGAIDALGTAPLDAKAHDPATPQTDAAQAFTDRDASASTALAFYGVGAALAALGGAAAGIGFAMGGE